MNEDESRAKRWHIWWNGVVATAEATPEGQQFKAAGFRLEHTGGGCTAWEREIEGTGWRIMITDSEGLGHELEGDHSFRPDMPDCWMIGAHNDDDEYAPCEEAATVDRALEIADAIQKGIAA